ncbi:MAG: hypothetical protein ACREOO_10935 [bacterium]
MNYEIAVPPELRISPDDFVAAWNETPECREAAIAHKAEPRTRTRSFDPSSLTPALAVLGTVAAGVGTNALYDLIKQALTRKGVKKQTEITQIERPDGTKILIVKIIENQ